MNNYIILSNKSWNKKLIDDMKLFFPNDNWFFICDKNEFSIERISKINPDYIFIPHWSYIIKKEIYEHYNCIVFHMTDLPFGRGGSPLQNLISRKIIETKMTAIKVEEDLDAGPIFLKEKLSLFGSAEEIFLRANQIISQMIKKIINKKLVPKPQIGKPVFFKRRTPLMSEITDQILNVEDLFDHIRMLDAEGYPKSYLENKFFKFEFSRAILKSNQSIISDVKITKK